MNKLEENLSQSKYAEHRNADAQYSLGDMYYQGQGVPHDYEETTKWLELAAEQGHEEAQDDLDHPK